MMAKYDVGVIGTGSAASTVAMRCSKARAGGLPSPGCKVLWMAALNKCCALRHCVIRTISASSTSSCAAKLTCCATGSVSLLRIGVCRCASATLRAAVSRWTIVSLNDFVPPL